MNYILLTEKKWHDVLFEYLSVRSNEEWVRISDRKDFNLETLKSIRPDRIFIPHWSYIIPASIYELYECIVFHMTDLPFGRGGSPLQNLIVRGHKETIISALRVNQGIDTGPIYLKKPLSLQGTAQEIFERASSVIEKMIPEIIEQEIKPVSQVGEPVIFKRRKRSDGQMNKLNNVPEVYDYIRMLDAEGYPPAYVETESLKIEFFSAENINETEVTANVRITKK
ncbi:MAG: methionyl-tRNA formyltransferase [Parvicella sp.]|jgi:methionyl-tRNA formyltransferase